MQHIINSLNIYLDKYMYYTSVGEQIAHNQVDEAL